MYHHVLNIQIYQIRININIHYYLIIMYDDVQSSLLDPLKPSLINPHALSCPLARSCALLCALMHSCMLSYALLFKYGCPSI